jgi:predicted NBD/HSP70 family sugar kinase
MTYYTGIDVSLRSVSICVVNDKGEVCLEAKVAAEIDAIVECLHRFDREVRSVVSVRRTRLEFDWGCVKDRVHLRL